LRPFLHVIVVLMLVLVPMTGGWGLCAQDVSFRRGDANADAVLDVSDGVRVLEFLFLGSAEIGCSDAGDVDDSGDLALNDAVFLFNSLFVDGTPIPPPRDACGSDPTLDALPCAAFDPCDEASPATNVLLIVSDDLGVDFSACYGSSASELTPNLERLCATGVVFQNAWSYPVCSPTRASILTGQYGFRTGVGDVIGGSSEFPLDALTLPRAFDASTALERAHACVGKWHLARRVETEHPNQAGFSHYSGALVGLGSYSSWEKIVNGESVAVSRYATSENVDDAGEWIATQGEQPWFLWLAFNAPHTPFHLPPAALHSSSALSGSTEDIEANPEPYYRAAIEAMDTEIGRLLAAMDPEVLARTHIIYVGDNGSPAQIVEADQRRRAKGSLYEGGVHVPLVVAGPAVVDGGRAVDAIVHVSDLFATILELGGVDVDAVVPSGTPIDAVSLVPYLESSSQAPLREFVLTERFGDDVPPNAAGRAVRDARYKLIRFENGSDQLYDLDVDPGETDDLLAVAQPTAEAVARRDALAAALEELLAE